MLKTYFLLPAIAISVIILAACSAPAPATQAPASVPTFSAPPTVEAAANPPSIQPTAAGGGAALAPICKATSSCEALNAEQIQLDCVKKVPYTNVIVPSGTDFEVLDKTGNFTCVDSGYVVGGNKVISCRGKELFSFQLKLTNTSCGGDNLATGTGQCQDGYGFDSAQNCCAPLPSGSGGSAGSTTVTVNLGGCPIPNSSRP